MVKKVSKLSPKKGGTGNSKQHAQHTLTKIKSTLDKPEKTPAKNGARAKSLSAARMKGKNDQLRDLLDLSIPDLLSSLGPKKKRGDKKGGMDDQPMGMALPTSRFEEKKNLEDDLDLSMSLLEKL